MPRINTGTRSDKNKPVTTRMYINPTPGGFIGWIEDRGKNWIAYFQADGRTLFFPHRAKDGTGATLGEGFWSEKPGSPLPTTQKRYDRAEILQKPPKVRRPNANKGVAGAPHQAPQEAYNKEMFERDAKRFLDGVCHLTDVNHRSPLVTSTIGSSPHPPIVTGCGLPKNHHGGCDPNPPANISWLALWRLGKTHFPEITKTQESK